MTSFGVYVGAFDDQGYILIVFDCIGKDDIIDIYQTTFFVTAQHQTGCAAEKSLLSFVLASFL